MVIMFALFNDTQRKMEVHGESMIFCISDDAFAAKKYVIKCNIRKLQRWVRHEGPSCGLPTKLVA